MDTVWLVITEDRHTDVRVEVYRGEDAALEGAEEIVADEYDYEPTDEDEDDAARIMASEAVPTWPFFAYLSGEGDCVYVTEAEVNESDD